MSVQIQHDKEGDTLYVRLVAERVVRTEEVEMGHVLVDRGADGHIIGIEVILPTAAPVEFVNG